VCHELGLLVTRWLWNGRLRLSADTEGTALSKSEQHPTPAVQLPIFASDETSPEIYRTVKQLLGYAEAIDIRNGQWSRIYDAAGNRLLLVVEPGDVIQLRGTPESEPDELADWLRSSLLALGHQKTGLEEAWLRTASLTDLVAAFDAHDAAWRAQLPLARVRRKLRTLLRRVHG
jgi:hypothetical protein